MLSSTATKVMEHVARPLSSWPATEEHANPPGKEGTKSVDEMAVDAVDKAERTGAKESKPNDGYDVRMNGFAKLDQ